MHLCHAVECITSICSAVFSVCTINFQPHSNPHSLSRSYPPTLDSLPHLWGEPHLRSMWCSIALSSAYPYHRPHRGFLAPLSPIPPPLHPRSTSRALLLPPSIVPLPSPFPTPPLSLPFPFPSIPPAFSPPPPALPLVVVLPFSPCKALSSRYSVTKIGRVIATLNAETLPCLLILYGAVFGVLEECLVMASIVSKKSPILLPIAVPVQAARTNAGYAAYAQSDLIAGLHAYLYWQKCKRKGAFSVDNEYEWCKGQQLSLFFLREVCQGAPGKSARDKV